MTGGRFRIFREPPPSAVHRRGITAPISNRNTVVRPAELANWNSVFRRKADLRRCPLVAAPQIVVPGLEKISCQWEKRRLRAKIQRVYPFGRVPGMGNHLRQSADIGSLEARGQAVQKLEEQIVET
jgi:hypothetical protein